MEPEDALLAMVGTRIKFSGDSVVNAVINIRNSEDMNVEQAADSITNDLAEKYLGDESDRIPAGIKDVLVYLFLYNDVKNNLRIDKAALDGLFAARTKALAFLQALEDAAEKYATDRRKAARSSVDEIVAAAASRQIAGESQQTTLRPTPARPRRAF